MNSRLTLAGLGFGTILLLTACSSSTTSSTATHPAMNRSSGMAGSGGMSMRTSSSTAQAAHNSADVTFATEMISHHRQAVTMADMALGTSKNAQVRNLATRIKAAQSPEITMMSGWLTAWNSPEPDASTDGSTGGMGSMGHGSTSMPGMMSTAQMTRLAAATGTAFDKLFLTEMISHHQGALAMARTEIGSGSSADAKALAGKIIVGQTKEIAEMKTVLPTLH